MNSQIEQISSKLKSTEAQNHILEIQLENFTNENNHLKSDITSTNPKTEIEIQNLKNQFIVQEPNLENQLKESFVQIDDLKEENQISIQI
jgi:hypothetical protein